ncbi:hypothetical protein [Saccharopolyspora sp. NPDC002376]
MAIAKYTLKSTAMWLDGREHRRGDTVELDTERGAELVELGALEAADGKAAAEEPVTDDGGEELTAPKTGRGTKTATSRKE